MEEAPVTYASADGIATITINRPEVRNAMNHAAAEAMQAALDRLEADDDVSVGIIAGAGGMFCAGMDLKALTAGEPRPITDPRGVFGICGRPPAKVLIAAVERFALGGGLEIALSCDLIVAGADAKLGLPEVKRGLVAAAGGIIRLPRRIPAAVASELILTGESIDPQRALELGLLSRVTEPGQALAAASELAGRIAANAPLAIQAAKAIMTQSAALSVEDALERQGPLIATVRRSDDAAEGARAFVEKRAPVWRGR